MGKRYRRKGGLPGLPRLCRGGWAKERLVGNDRKQTWGSESKLLQNMLGLGTLRVTSPYEPSSWSVPLSTSHSPCPASQLGRERRKESWLKPGHSGLFTNSTVLLGPDTASSI